VFSNSWTLISSTAYKHFVFVKQHLQHFKRTQYTSSYQTTLRDEGMGCITPETRHLMVKARKRGCMIKEVTAMFEVSRWTVWRWTKRAHRRGRKLQG
jgi:hypothetical protein